jgi:hypothetical protein
MRDPKGRDAERLWNNHEFQASGSSMRDFTGDAGNGEALGCEKITCRGGLRRWLYGRTGVALGNYAESFY